MNLKPSLLIWLLPVSLVAAEVQTGDNRAAVEAALGAPNGQVSVGDRSILYFDRGQVELQDGRVSRIALISASEFEAQEARRSAAATRLREEAEIKRARSTAEGAALKEKKLADPAFRASPVALQVAFWEDFARRYPEVPSSEELAAVRVRFSAEMEDRRARLEQEKRIAELEARVAEAEARADDALDYSSYRARTYRIYSQGAAPYPFTLWPVGYPAHFGEQPWATPSGPVVTPLVPPAVRDRQAEPRRSDAWRGGQDRKDGNDGSDDRRWRGRRNRL
jgi:hypothetical protein